MLNVFGDLLYQLIFNKTKNMETTIIKNVKASTMVKIFNDSTDNISVRHFDITTKEGVIKGNQIYRYSITIRHAENTDADILFQNEIDKIEKKSKVVKKRNFLVSTEKGRTRGKISFYIAEIMPNVGLKLIDNNYTCSTRSTESFYSQVINLLVRKNELPKKYIIKDVLASNYNRNELPFNIIFVEGHGLNYINQY